MRSTGDPPPLSWTMSAALCMATARPRATSSRWAAWSRRHGATPSRAGAGVQRGRGPVHFTQPAVGDTRPGGAGAAPACGDPSPHPRRSPRGRRAPQPGRHHPNSRRARLPAGAGAGRGAAGDCRLVRAPDPEGSAGRRRVVAAISYPFQKTVVRSAPKGLSRRHGEEKNRFVSFSSPCLRVSVRDCGSPARAGVRERWSPPRSPCFDAVRSAVYGLMIGTSVLRRNGRLGSDPILVSGAAANPPRV